MGVLSSLKTLLETGRAALGEPTQGARRRLSSRAPGANVWAPPPRSGAVEFVREDLAGRRTAKERCANVSDPHPLVREQSSSFARI